MNRTPIGLAGAVTALLGAVALAFTGLGVSDKPVIAWCGLAALVIGFGAMALSGRDYGFKKYLAALGVTALIIIVLAVLKLTIVR